MSTTEIIDFMVIGAQKSGTTSLHEVIGRHPEIFTPSGKEHPIFSNMHTDLDSIKLELEKIFAKSNGLLRGKVSPQYLANPIVAERIFALSPNVKLIVVIRDPVERAYSHYRMCCRRSGVSEEFSSMVMFWLKANNLDRARRTIFVDGNDEIDYCVAWSEYVRMLGPFRRLFPPDQLLLISAHELAKNPYVIYQTVFQFLGVDDAWRTAHMTKKYHVGGDSNLINFKKLKRVPVLGLLLRFGFRYLPEKLKYMINTRNIRARYLSVYDTYPTSAELLRAHLSQDAELVDGLSRSEYS